MIDRLSTTVRELLLAQTEEELCQTAVAALDQLLESDRSTIVPADECTPGVQAWTMTESPGASDQLSLISGLVGEAYTSGESLVIDDLSDTRSASTQSPPSDSTYYRSLLCVPVDELGTLVTLAHDAEAFADADIEAIEQLRSYVTAAFTRITSPATRQDEHDRIQEVASILVHDVRNPLTVANGHLELAREEHESEHLAQVATAHERLEELIEDAVTLVRTGERVDETDGIDLRDVARRAWKMVETREAELTVVESRPILADESRLCQLFENLFRNAVVHGGPTVTVQAGLLDESMGFYVEDDGSGIPSDERESIFDRGHSSAENGTGLGLFIVEAIVEAHEWKITATESARGGARFEITDLGTR